ncbi:MAG: TonB-dependent receptor [Ignavibacterium sp.]
MKKFGIIFLLSIYSISIAQGITIKGKVIDAKTNEPIQGAILLISNNYYYSNSNGEYIIKNLSQDKYEINVSHINYKMKLETIYIGIQKEIIKDFYLTPTLIELDEVFVSSKRSESLLKNSPYSEILLDKNQIEDKSLTTISDALSKEPGITLQRDGIWGTEINIRGLSKQNIVTLIDNNRIETATDIAARLSMFDLNDIERIEVIKGAASSIYGSGAIGGIINIVSKQPEFSVGVHPFGKRFFLDGNISTGYNSVNNLGSFAGNVFGSSNLLSFKISGSYRNANNIKTPIGKIKNSQFEDYSFSSAVNFKLFENQILKLNYQLFKAEDVGIPGAEPNFPNNADVRYPQEKRELISAVYEIKNLSKVLNNISLTFSHQYILRDVENIPHQVQNIPAQNGQPPKRVSVLKITPNADHNNNSIQLQSKFILSRNNIFLVGFDYWKRKYEGERFKYQKIEILDPITKEVNKTSNVIIAEKPLPNSSFESIGFFVQDDAQLITNKLHLTFGGRIDRINIKGVQTLNPLYQITDGLRNDTPTNQKIIWNDTKANDVSYSTNFGLLYSLISNLDLSLSLGYSFRSPSLEERFQYIDLGSLVRLGNPYLDPEKGYSADFGIRLYSLPIKFTSSFFFNYLTDLITEEPTTYENRPAKIKTNIGEARLYGFDLQFDYNFFKEFVFYSIVSFVKGDDITGDTNLPEIPPLNGTVGIKFNVFNYFDADFSSTIFAPQNDVAIGEIKTPGYAIFNFGIITEKIKFNTFDFKFVAGVENIFNKSYRNHLSTTRGSITVEPGRNFYIKLISHF